jgi:hypothetical protein
LRTILTSILVLKKMLSVDSMSASFFIPVAARQETKSGLLMFLF